MFNKNLVYNTVRVYNYAVPTYRKIYSIRFMVHNYTVHLFLAPGGNFVRKKESKIYSNATNWMFFPPCQINHAYQKFKLPRRQVKYALPLSRTCFIIYYSQHTPETSGHLCLHPESVRGCRQAGFVRPTILYIPENISILHLHLKFVVGIFQ